MIECPHCKKPIGSGAVICPYYKGQTICMSHCWQCKHGYESLSAEIRCRYYDDKKMLQLAREDALRAAQAAADDMNNRRNSA